MGDDGLTRDDVKVPEGDIGKEIKDKFDTGEQQYLVTILKACTDETAIAIKNMPK